MTRTLLSLVVFIAGLAVTGWVGAGYWNNNPIALGIIVLISVVYITGAIELLYFQRGTRSLSRAINTLQEAPSDLNSWLKQLQPALRGATRLRIEGQRVALPGLTLTPYLVGLLVLLGMLGTFLGMVATLRGTGIALESAVDIQAIRASLAAPVDGLGFAFGTSVAGVAASAALGLLATLSRRSRIQTAQELDTVLATTLRPYSQSHHHEQTHKLMQQQAQTMPILVDRLEAMMAAIEKQTQALHDRLSINQEAFYSRTEKAYGSLATSIEQALKQSVVDSAHIAGQAIQPAVENTLAGLARETSAWQDSLALAIRHQIDTLSDRFASTTSSVADIWKQALDQQQHTNSALAQDNQRVLSNATEQLAQHASVLLQRVDQSHLDLQNNIAAQDQQRLQAWVASLEQVSSGLRSSFEGTAQNVHASMIDTAHTLQTSMAGMTHSLDLGLKNTVDNLRDSWQQASSHATAQQQSICETLEKTANQLTLQTQSHARDTITEVSQLLRTVSEAPTVAAHLMDELRQSHETLQSTLIANDQQRLNDWKATLDHIASHWNGSLQSTATGLRQEWAKTTEQTAVHQQTICETLAKTAQELTEQTQTHARSTIAEVSQLLHTVSEAPKVAAEIITELHHSHVDLQAQLIAQDQQRLNDWKASLDQISSQWNESLQTTSSTLRTVMDKTSTSLSSSLTDTASTLNASLTQTVSTLKQEWADTTAQAVVQQKTICDTLAQTAATLSSHTQAQARDTITEVSQLLLTVSAVPKAAAEVIAELNQSHADLQTKLIAQDEQRLDSWKSSLDTIASSWNTSLVHTTEALSQSLETTAVALNQSLEKTATTLNASMQGTATSLSASLTGTTSTLSATLENTASALHNAFDDIASSMHVSLENTSCTLRQEWEQASHQTARRQQEVCDTLSKTAQTIVEHTQKQANDTIAEVSLLVQTAAEAPRAAATVISELRQKLSDGIARDNELLEERGRLMDTLSTLLDAVNHASTQQRDVVDTLITNSTALLERVGSQFTHKIQSETDKLAGAAAHITGSAIEVASLGDAFSTSVQLFNQSNDKLVDHLQRIENALSKSMTRSDEQLAYYVAQAREVVDLSILSQKQIITDLQQLAHNQTPRSII